MTRPQQAREAIQRAADRQRQQRETARTGQLAEGVQETDVETPESDRDNA